MSQGELLDKFLQNAKRAQKGKEQAMGEQSRVLDPFSKYALISPKPLPPEIMLAKLRAEAVYEWMATPPIDNLGMLIWEGIVKYYERIESGFAAVPSVMVDPEGAYEILAMGGGMTPPDTGLMDVEPKSD